MISRLQASFLWTEPESASFAEAIEVTRRSGRSSRARRDNLTLANEEIQSWRIGMQSVELLLSSGRVLRIHVAGDVVDWEFDQAAVLPEQPRFYAEEVQLELPGGQLIVWRPDLLIAGLQSAGRLGLAPSTTLVTLEGRHHFDISFGQMVDHLGQRMLWFEEE
ncbi:MAG: hypothetical protein JNM69_40055 [Archangium sp.]|nr:hypothetical protein [Archangium sp.]